MLLVMTTAAGAAGHHHFHVYQPVGAEEAEAPAAGEPRPRRGPLGAAGGADGRAQGDPGRGGGVRGRWPGRRRRGLCRPTQLAPDGTPLAPLAFPPDGVLVLLGEGARVWAPGADGAVSGSFTPPEGGRSSAAVDTDANGGGHRRPAQPRGARAARAAAAAAAGGARRRASGAGWGWQWSRAVIDRVVNDGTYDESGRRALRAAPLFSLRPAWRRSAARPRPSASRVAPEEETPARGGRRGQRGGGACRERGGGCWMAPRPKARRGDGDAFVNACVLGDRVRP